MHMNFMCFSAAKRTVSRRAHSQALQYNERRLSKVCMQLTAEPKEQKILMTSHSVINGLLFSRSYVLIAQHISYILWLNSTRIEHKPFWRSVFGCGTGSRQSYGIDKMLFSFIYLPALQHSQRTE